MVNMYAGYIFVNLLIVLRCMHTVLRTGTCFARLQASEEVATRKLLLGKKCIYIYIYVSLSIYI